MIQVNRRDLIKGGAITGGVMALGGLSLSQIACGSPKDLARYVGLVVEELNAIGPELQILGLPLTQVNKAIAIANDLKKAFQASDNKTALQLLSELTASDGLIQAIANDVGLIHDARIQKIVEAALLSVHFTLALISANIQKDVPQAAGMAAASGMGAEAANVARATGKIASAFQIVFHP